jgi:Tfp pilus assembly protein PilX
MGCVRILRRRIRVLGDERGIALVMALGMLIVLGIVGGTITYYSTSNYHMAAQSTARTSAYQLAEAGINDAIAKLQAQLDSDGAIIAGGTDPRSSSLLATPTTVQYTSVNGSVTYSGTIDSSYVWTITSKGQVTNAGKTRTRTLTKKVSLIGINDGANGIAWTRFYQDDPNQCLTIDTVTWTAPVSTRGDLCLVNGGTITGSSTTVDVGGDVTITGPPTSSGVKSPSNASGWTSSTNVYTSNSVYATNSISSNSTGATLTVKGYGFSIPTSAVIDGISVSVIRKASVSNTISDSTVQLLKAGNPVGSNKASSSKWGTSNSTVNYGDTDDLWSTTWTAADVNNANFGVKFVAKAGSTAATASVDYISVTVTYSGDTNGIGTSGTHVAEVNVNGTCRYNANAAHSPCGTADHVYADSTSSSAQNLSMPQVDFNYWWANAAPGPKHPCTTSSGTPPTFDNDANTTTGPNDSISINGEMAPLTYDYTCQVWQNGYKLGELSWNHTTHDMTIDGTVFIDGNFRFDNDGQVIHYHGRGDIYAGGAAEIDAVVCAGGSGTSLSTSCYGDMSNWDPADNLLVLLSAYTGSAEYDQGGSTCSPSGTTACPNGHYASGFQGVLYSKGDCLIHEQFRDSGPVICNTISLPDESDGWPSYYSYPALQTVTDGQKYSNTATATHFEIDPGQESG